MQHVCDSRLIVSMEFMFNCLGFIMNFFYLFLIISSVDLTRLGISALELDHFAILDELDTLWLYIGLLSSLFTLSVWFIDFPYSN